MFFAVSGVECSPFLLFFASLGISFFTSIGGVSGAFLLLPFQILVLGYTAPSVSATNQLFNIIACPSGIWRYWREGRLLVPLALYMAGGTLPGVFIGAWLRAGWLADFMRFAIFAAFVLAYIGIRLFLEKDRKKSSTNDKCSILTQSFSRFTFAWAGDIYEVRFIGIFILSAIVGLIGGIYGIGGGALMAPFLLSIFGLPVYVVAGATLFATFLTSVAGVSFFTLFGLFGKNISPDWLLGLTMGLGGMAGMYMGASIQKKVPARIIRFALALVILFVASQFFLGAISR